MSGSSVSGVATNAAAYSFFNSEATTTDASSSAADGFSFFDSESSSDTNLESILDDYCWQNNVELSGSQKNAALAGIDSSQSESEISQAIAASVGKLDIKS